MKETKRVPPCRLYVILAREATVGVIFRRGPSKWVQLVMWHTESDTFEAGQWFRGRIYERRCDLSPDGSLLIYFASKINGRTLKDTEYTYAWTAISRPPYLTALALWPKGDCWHGGGVFESASRVWLNHLPAQAIPHPEHRPQGIEVMPNPEAEGEDYAVWARRMRQSGWTCVQEGSYELVPETRNFRTQQAETWEKKAPDAASTLVYELKAINIAHRLGGMYVETYTLKRSSQPSITVPGVSWADWDHSGRLVFTRDGSLFIGDVQGDALIPRELTNLNGNRPEPVEAPEWARRW